MSASQAERRRFESGHPLLTSIVLITIRFIPLSSPAAMALPTSVVTALVIGLLPRSALAEGRHDIPRVVPGPQVVYRCAGGSELVASYFSLSDRSLDFVRLRLPEGQRSTLP
jgi:hypothetical protein